MSRSSTPLDATRRARARSAAAPRLPQGDGVLDAHQARRRGDRHRRRDGRSRPELPALKPETARRRPHVASEAGPDGQTDARLRRRRRRQAAAGRARSRRAPAAALLAMSAAPPARSGSRPTRRGRAVPPPRSRSTPRPTRPSPASSASTPGSPRPPSAAASPSTRDDLARRAAGELVGISLATAPGKAAYIPLGHRNGGGDLLGGGLLPGQIPLARGPRAAEAAARGPVGPEDRAEPQVRLPRLPPATASTSRPIDDTMLISYALDAGKGGNGMDELSGALARPQADHLQGRRRLRQAAGDLRPRRHRPGDRICRRGRRRRAPPVDGAEAAARRRAHDQRLRDAGAAAGAGAGAHGGARHQGRPPDPVAPVRRVRPEARRRSRPRSTSLPASASTSARRSSSATSSSASSGCPAARRPRPAPGRPAPTCSRSSPRTGNELAARILDWRQLSKLKSTYTDLAARLHPSRHRPRPHLLRAGLDHHRPPVVVRPEPAEHPDPHRGRPAHPHRLHRRAGHEADLGRLQPDRAPRPRPRRRHPAAASRPSPTASTSTP